MSTESFTRAGLLAATTQSLPGGIARFCAWAIFGHTGICSHRWLRPVCFRLVAARIDCGIGTAGFTVALLQATTGHGTSTASTSRPPCYVRPRSI